MKLRTTLSSLALAGVSLFLALPAAAKVEFTITDFNTPRGVDIYIVRASNTEACGSINYTQVAPFSVYPQSIRYPEWQDFTSNTLNMNDHVCIRAVEKIVGYTATWGSVKLADMSLDGKVALKYAQGGNLQYSPSKNSFHPVPNKL